MSFLHNFLPVISNCLTFFLLMVEIYVFFIKSLTWSGFLVILLLWSISFLLLITFYLELPFCSTKEQTAFQLHCTTVILGLHFNGLLSWFHYFLHLMFFFLVMVGGGVGKIVFTLLGWCKFSSSLLRKYLKGNSPEFLSENTIMPYMTIEFSIVSNFPS